jgi:glycerol-3-phosphate dehydrogenase
MGVMVILDYRVVNRVINRMRMPADGDIIVPGDTVSIIGTTSRNVPEEELDHLLTQPEEIRRMITGATEMVPLFGESRMLRYYSGARPLPGLGGSSGREVSRNFVINDHADSEGPDNVISIVGGKLMTYRLMAEKLSDLVARKLGNSQPCQTSEAELPPVDARDLSRLPTSIKHNYGVVTGLYRQGEPLLEPLSHEQGQRLICECEMVTEAELVHVAARERIQNISDLRRRTRLGMGPCQGTLCGMRTMETGIFAQKPFAEKNEILENFIQERWKGIRFILWGDTMRMEEFSMWLYQGIWGW